MLYQKFQNFFDIILLNAGRVLFYGIIDSWLRGDYELR